MFVTFTTTLAGHPVCPCHYISLCKIDTVVDNINSIGGDECFNYDEFKIRSIDPSILSTINELHRPVSLAVDCYIYTRDMKARLDNLSCLRSLRVCFQYNTPTNLIGGGANEELGSNPFQDIVKIVSKNTRLKHLHLSIKKKRDFSLSLPPIFTEMRDHALGILGRTIPDLESLVLEGDLHFTDKALKIWTKPLSQLQSLQIMGVPLVLEITGSLQGQMSALQTLKLSAFQDVQDYITFHGDSVSLKAFLSTLVLTDLSLLGFPPGTGLARRASSFDIVALHRAPRDLEIHMPRSPETHS